ncbi:MAG: ABC transporter permease [Chitinophagales bacterium]
MLGNYLKIAWRNITKNKIYSIINIVGLATGMAVTILIGLWIWDEISFNHYHRNHERIASVMIQQTMKGETYTGETVAIPPADGLSKYADAFKYVSLVAWNGEPLFNLGEKKISAAAIWVQPDFPKMFSLHMIDGNIEGLKDPSSLFVSQSFAKALFDQADPINKVVKIENRTEMKIAGVYEDLPHNTSYYGTQVLMAWDNKDNFRRTQTDWENHCAQLFVQLNDHIDADKTTERIRSLPTPHIKDYKEELILHPMDKMYLYNEFSLKDGKVSGGRIEFVRLFGMIAVFVLLLACINFMNLSTARSERRAKEVGIRKTVGSMRRQLIGQFLCESILVAFLAFILSIFLTAFSIRFFNSLADKQVSIPVNYPLFWLMGLGFTLITGIVAGSYPAFYLSAFEPIKVLKGTFRSARLAGLPRKILVVTQFSISIILIIGTLIVYSQIQFAKDRPMGYSRQGLITIPINTGDVARNFEAIRNELLLSRTVENLAQSSYSASNFGQNNSVDWDGKDPGLVIFFRDVNVSPDFGKTIGWKILEGRDFSRDFPGDSGTTTILNEAAAKIVGYKDPVGKKVRWQGKDHTIIGIVKDMVTQSPYDPIEPAIFFNEGWKSVITVRIKPTVPMSVALAKIGLVFKKYNPNSPFIYRFVDDEYSQKFSAEQRIGNLATFFAVLAIFISCLGLFGLAAFVAERRTKEIGVRKVLGAGVINLWALLSKEFVALVSLSCLIAIPIAWHYLDKWLNNYSYRITISWWVFAWAALGALGITIITVSYQTIRAALMNPTKSLRSE